VSRTNKVNPDHYTQAGRLTPDDLARERKRQGDAPFGGRRRKQKAMPPWMANEQAGGAGGAGTPGAAGGADAAGAARAENAGDSADSEARGAAEGTGSDRGEVTARKRKRPAPRRKVTGQAPGKAKRKSTKTSGGGSTRKASGARGTPKTRKAPKARASAARGSSRQRAGAPGMRKGRTKGKGVTRKTQKKKRS
jgi:hypothetical protein